jgi:hypothetical protein
MEVHQRSLTLAQVERVLEEMETLCEVEREPITLSDDPVRLAILLARQQSFRWLRGLLEDAWGTPLLEHREDPKEPERGKLSAYEYLQDNV